MSESIFKRHELKFMVSDDQRAALEAVFADTMEPDPYGESTICNVYYDTPDYRLIRASLEKPIYKEKLRSRSYGPADPEGMVFLELKKKYDGIVYKRRITLPAQTVEDYFAGDSPLPDSQIAREIDYCRSFYRDLRPALYLSYDRCAFFSNESRDLRVTFDKHIAWRRETLRLTAPAGGREILPPGCSLMEIKAADAIPFWLVRTLSRENIRQTSFSKYGEAYKTIQSESLCRKAGNDE